MEDEDVLKHRVERLEERVGKHGEEIDDLKIIVTKLTVIEEGVQSRGRQIFGAVLTIGVGVVGVVLASVGLG